MKTSLKANLLKHFITKKEEGGFTLIELLVVIIIIGILAAIALPSFLNQANKARQSEAKTYVGSMNRGQQAYRLENPRFAPNFNDLAIGIPTTTSYYTYTIPDSGAFGGTSVATALDPGLKGYIGGVQLNAGSASAEATTIAIICEATAAGITAPTKAAITGFNEAATATTLACATNWKKM